MTHGETFDVCESDNIANGVDEKVSMYRDSLHNPEYRNIGHIRVDLLIE